MPSPTTIDTVINGPMRRLTAQPFINNQGARVELELVRYFDDETQAEESDGCSLAIQGEALLGCSAYSDGRGICCTVESAVTLRALGQALAALADEAERHGLFSGVEGWTGNADAAQGRGR